MGEAKRRKQLDSNYGKKQYSIEFLDYQSWKALFSEESMQDFVSKFKNEELIKSLFQKVFWGGNIIIEDSSYIFTIKLVINNNKPDLAVYISSTDNDRHEMILEQNKDRIRQEMLEIVRPPFEKVIEKGIEEFMEEYLENFDDEFDEDEFNEDELLDDLEK